tara:strand:+ start:4317 stop:4685 length:369 start_codon:yes stop_codon:yes gene_type:complete
MEDSKEWVWTESEYNFFMTLQDEDKLEYMYDYFNSLFFFDGDESDTFEYEIDLEDDGEHHNSTAIDVMITDTHFIIKCDDEEIALKTISTFQMDGYIIMFESKKNNTHTYKYIGMAGPFSVN